MAGRGTQRDSPDQWPQSRWASDEGSLASANVVVHWRDAPPPALPRRRQSGTRKSIMAIEKRHIGRSQSANPSALAGHAGSVREEWGNRDGPPDRQHLKRLMVRLSDRDPHPS